MTEYAYKLVSLKAQGQVDWPALLRARKRGWEPVPLGEEPNPFPNPLGMTESQMQAFRLCRMPKDEHDRQREDREFLNAALADEKVHTAIAKKSVPGSEKLLPDVASYAGPPTDSAVFNKRVSVAYAWLHARGLA